jgi:hypothetical protein
LTQEEIENLNRLIISKEIESVIKNFPTKKAQDKMASLMKCTRYLKRNEQNISQTLPKN